MNFSNKHTSMRRGGRMGFTLIEMMIVCALISIMAAMAIFSILTMMEQAKQRTSLAECRQVATAAGFANNDLAFYPKLCFLKMSYTTLATAVSGKPVTPDYFVECHGHQVSNFEHRMGKNWSKTGAYLSSSQQRNTHMYVPGAYTAVPGETFDWPGDPWGNPYVMYLMKSNYDTASGKIQPRFIEKAGEHPDYFAAVVSYGRNTVPGGLAADYIRLERDPARGLERLYEKLDAQGTKVYRSLQPAEYVTPGRVKHGLLNIDPAGNVTIPSPTDPRMREPNSDDLIVEF